MGPYDERLPLIDAAIYKHNGEWPDEKCDFLSMAGRANAIYKRGDILPTLGGDGDGKDGFWYTVCTRQEFEQRAVELQNKPSWDDAPDWANWLAQDDDGEWWFFGSKPRYDIDCFAVSSGCTGKSGKGEVIGNWQDTLEKRPEKTLEEIGIHIEREKVSTQLWSGKTKEKDMNNDWHKKGERVSFPTGTGTLVIAESDINDVVIVRDDSGEYKKVSATAIKKFQTETDKLADDILSYWNDKGVDCPIQEWELAEYLHGLGYRKTKPMSEMEFMKRCVDVCGHGSAQLYRDGARFLEGAENE